MATKRDGEHALSRLLVAVRAGDVVLERPDDAAALRALLEAEEVERERDVALRERDEARAEEGRLWRWLKALRGREIAGEMLATGEPPDEIEAAMWDVADRARAEGHAEERARCLAIARHFGAAEEALRMMGADVPAPRDE